jgi:hypothetical protein
MPEFKISIEEVTPKGSGPLMILYWLFIGWWLLPFIWFCKAYLWAFKNFPKATVGATAVFLITLLIQQSLHNQKVEDEKQLLLSNESYLPSQQKAFLMSLAEIEKEANGGSAGEELVTKKRLELVKSNNPIKNWIGELIEVESTTTKNLGFIIRLKGTDLKFLNYKTIATDYAPQIVRNNSPLFDKLAKIPVNSEVIFSGKIVSTTNNSGDQDETLFELSDISTFEAPKTLK